MTESDDGATDSKGNRMRRRTAERGRIRIVGFDADRVRERDPLSEWSEAGDEPTGERDDGANAGSDGRENGERVTNGTTVGRWRRGFRRFRRNRSAMVALGVVVAMALVSLLARPVEVFGVVVQPFALAPYDPTTILYLSVDPSVSPYDPPSARFPMGVDGAGRDLFSRVLVGGRYSISIGFVVVGLTAAFGLFYGAISGYYGGRVDEAMMRIVDVVFAFPGLVLALVVVATLGGGYWQLVLAFSLFGWAGYARLVRGEVLSIAERDYVLAAKAVGARDRGVIRRHVAPNALSSLVVLASLNVGSVVIGVAALGFLGLGMDPSTAEWGTMLDATRETLIRGPGGAIPWWATVYPGGAIFVFVLAVNVIGDGINDALDARAIGVDRGGRGGLEGRGDARDGGGNHESRGDEP
ncbi:ABC transporter permease [Halorubrum cibi]|uniref:Peptide/nickel transport system permease protein n=1 Tax=Halorubrum cibi TaxID=413815 RepID=A0A521AWJ7_9EURY|nr:ABC transporter permease [Halorubrum cibi]SMO39199.1 peptide/nickel transport system permease protein [Halorubrum cibi]